MNDSGGNWRAPEGLSAQAQMIWSMLDDMAESDPSAYKNFIEKQIKEGKAQLALPEPHLCIEVLLHKKPRRPLFINFCSWSKLPEPKSNLHPVPVTGTEITDHEKDSDRGFYSITSVAFNGKVLEEMEKADKADRCTLFNLALDFIEGEHKVKVTRKYKILPKETIPYKGDLKQIQLSFAKNLRDRQRDQLAKNSEHRQNGAADTNRSKNKPFNENGFEESLLSRLSNIATGDSSSTSSFGSPNENGSSSIHIPGFSSSKQSNSKSSSKKGSKLIEVLKDDSSSSSNRLATPKYSLDQNETDAGHELILKVELPGVLSVSECQLDISEDDIKLLVPGHYDLHIKLPSCIDEDISSAKFIKRTSILTVTMPVKS